MHETIAQQDRTIAAQAAEIQALRERVGAFAERLYDISGYSYYNLRALGDLANEMRAAIAKCGDTP